MIKLAACTAICAILGFTPGFARTENAISGPGETAAMAALCGSAVTEQSCHVGRQTWTYWITFDTELNGRQLVTMVATGRTDGDEDSRGPADQLPISQITYELVGGRWRPLAHQMNIGRIYSSGSVGNPPDGDDEPLFRSALPDGVLVGYPTKAYQNEGVTTRRFAMFRTLPGKPGYWLFGGEIAGGGDNGAGNCDEPQSCYDSKGALFISGNPDAAGWPNIRVMLSGTVPGDNGKARPARPFDRQIWHYDADHKTYLPPRTR